MQLSTIEAHVLREVLAALRNAMPFTPKEGAAYAALVMAEHFVGKALLNSK